MALLFRSCLFMILAIITLVGLHANARELPKPKNKSTQNSATLHPNTITNSIENNLNPPKHLAKGDEKKCISFAGVGAAGGIGGAAGVVPIGFIDKGLGGLGGLGGVGGLGGGGLGGGGLGGGGTGGGLGGGGVGGVGGGGLGGCGVGCASKTP